MGITDPTEEYFKDGTWGWDGTLWRKLPIVWGYSDLYTEKLEEADAAAGANTLYASIVPAGEVWVVTVLTAVNVDNICTVLGLQFYDGSATFTMHQETTVAANDMVEWSGLLHMNATCRIRVKFEGCTLNDYLAVMIMGYKMAVA